MQTVSDLQLSVAGQLSGTDLDNVTNLFVAFERAVRQMKTRIYIPEASGRESLMLYSGVTDYEISTGVFGGALVDLRAQGIGLTPADGVYKQRIADFARTAAYLPNGYSVTFEWLVGVPRMRVQQNRTLPKINIDSMTSITGWVAGGNASGLALDSTVYYQQPGALRFNLAALGSQGYLEKTLTSPLDLSAYQGVGVVFLAVDLPPDGAAAIGSIGIHLGSDSGNYYDISETEGFLGAWTEDEYLLIALDLSLASQTGTPTITAMDYVRVYVNYNGSALSNVRFGGLWISLPSLHELLYESVAIFIPQAGSNTGIPQSTITADTDLIMLQDDAFAIFELEAAAAVAAQNGSIAVSTVESINTQLFGSKDRSRSSSGGNGLYDHYAAKHPNEELQVLGSWY